MWADGATPVEVRYLRVSEGEEWSRVDRKKTVLHGSSVPELPCSNRIWDGSKNFKLEPGLPSHYEGIFFKIGDYTF